MTAAAASRLFLPVLALLASSCAVPPPPPPLADLGGTDWHVALVNGRQTPTTGDYSLHFGRDGRFGARFGCNSMGADYTQTANILDLDMVIATQMACADMSFESQGGAILNEPMTMSWSGGDRLTLSNTRGRITLVRSY